MNHSNFTIHNVPIRKASGLVGTSFAGGGAPLCQTESLLTPFTGP